MQSESIGEKVKELLGYYCSVNVCLCLLGGMLFIKLHIPEHTRSLSGSLLGYKTIP